MYFIVFLFVLAGVAGHREVEILIKSESWFLWMTWLKFWKNIKVFGKEIKNTDSFHFMVGLFWLLVVSFILLQSIWVYLYADMFIEIWFLLIASGLPWMIISVILNIVIYWQTYMWFRNFFMHVAFMNSGSRQWKYVFPLIDLFDKYKKVKGKK